MSATIAPLHDEAGAAFARLESFLPLVRPLLSQCCRPRTARKGLDPPLQPAPRPDSVHESPLPLHVRRPEHEYTANGSVWTASRPAELRGTVAVDAGTSEYRLTDLAGTVTAFDQATGRWKSTRDRWGNVISGTYSSGSLTTLTDSAGRQLALAYSSGRLQSITVPDTTNRVWTFSSSGTPALLYSIRDPFHASGNPWRTLAYDGGYRLAAVSDDAMKLLEGHTYDAQGRGVTSYSEGGRGTTSSSITTRHSRASVASPTESTPRPIRSPSSRSSTREAGGSQRRSTARAPPAEAPRRQPVLHVLRRQPRRDRHGRARAR